MVETVKILSGKGSLKEKYKVFSNENRIILCDKNLREEYHNLFDKSVADFNKKQKDKNRIIKSYYNKIIDSMNGETLYKELIIQVSNNSKIDYKKINEILINFYSFFLKEYYNFKVIKSVIINSDNTTFLYLSFIPFSTKNNRGMSVKNSFRGALKNMGYDINSKVDYFSKIREFLKEEFKKNNIEILTDAEDSKKINLKEENKKLKKQIEDTNKKLDNYFKVNKFIGALKYIFSKRYRELYKSFNSK